nr:lysine-rich arabinogalactan protein 18-like [Setaria viridis]
MAVPSANPTATEAPPAAPSVRAAVPSATEAPLATPSATAVPPVIPSATMSFIPEAAQIAPVQSPQRSATFQVETGTPAIPPTEITLDTSIVPFQQPSARQLTEEASPSRAPIIIESSSSDEPIVPAPKMREQDTPNNSLFSFAVALSDDEEVASCQVTLSLILDDVRAKLESIRTLLQDDISRLVEDASPIRQLFSVRG